MTSRLNPYLNFDGDARQAMEFYQSVFGGELKVNTFGEFGAPEGMDPNKIMHAMLETNGGYTLMASDMPPGMPYNPTGNIQVSISGEDAVALRGYWKNLSEGGTVTMPMEKQAWGDEFGMCTDRFGIAWMIDIIPPQS